jgi:hypothetical protein
MPVLKRLRKNCKMELKKMKSMMKEGNVKTETTVTSVRMVEI